MQRSAFHVLAALLLASPLVVAQDKPDSKQDAAKKRPPLERELSLALEKAARAVADVEDQKADNAATEERIRVELGLAEAKLKVFEEREAPARLAKARHELQGAVDMLDDARDEFAQLEMMYKESEIGDKTKDMVLARSRRGLKRAEERLVLQKADVETLESRTLPLERERLVADLMEKKRELERAARGAAKALFEKSIAARAAANETTRLKEELAALDAAK